MLVDITRCSPVAEVGGLGPFLTILVSLYIVAIVIVRILVNASMPHGD